jgi:cytidylate kinase
VSERPFVVTLDGPAASGKSSAARGVAEQLGIPCVSSGLLYRAATALVSAARANPDSAEGVLATLQRHHVELIPGHQGDSLLIDGVECTRAVQSDEVDALVSRVAAHPEVRSWVGERLREMPPPFVIDGRDMGSVVFPDARYKFYLDASAEVRAQRRVGERQSDLQAVMAAIVQRDHLDARALQPAADARYLDTGPLTLAEVIGHVVAAVRRGADETA